MLLEQVKTELKEAAYRNCRRCHGEGVRPYFYPLSFETSCQCTDDRMADIVSAAIVHQPKESR